MTTRAYSRTGILAIILLGCMAIFVLRLAYLQIFKHKEYVSLAQASQQRNFVIPAVRGEIHMMDGPGTVPVVLNQVVFSVIADPAIIENGRHQEIIKTLREIAGGAVSEHIEQRLRNTTSRYEVLARNLTRSQAEQLEAKNFSGIVCQRGAIRSYPEGQLASQVLGFVNAEGKGQYGVEDGLNNRLKGRDGLLRSVTDVRNVPLVVGKNNVRIEPVSGENIVLSIDRTIQAYAEEALERGIKKVSATEGSVVILRPNDGAVLAMANYPTFNPAEYYTAHNPQVFINTATMVPYEPASVIKPFILATAIDKGAITPHSTYVNTDQLQVADHVIHNALRGHTGTLTMQQVLNMSLNTGTITAARRLGDGSRINHAARQTMYEYYHDKFGLGGRTGIEVGEVPGHIYPPNNAEGSEIRYSTMTFGQGMNVTMVQVAAGFASLINGGEYYKPTLVAGTLREGSLVAEPRKVVRNTVSPMTSAHIRSMLVQARRASWLGKGDRAGFAFGGKTGTAETVTSAGGYTKTETVATYIGFGGAEQPEYVIMVRVAAPGKGLNLEGGLHAGPIFTEISNTLIDYLKLAPKE